MIKIWPIWLVTILLLFNAFLVSTKLPNGLFSAKEIGFWLATGIACILAAISILNNKVCTQNIKSIDVVVIAFLILLPLVCLVIRGTNANKTAIITQVAYGFSYTALRVLFNIRAVVLANMIMELMIILLCFQLAIALAQHFSLIPSYYPRFGATGMFFNPGPFAIFTAALLVVVGVLFQQRLINNDYLKATFYGLLIATAVYFVICSLSRSAWLGALTGLFIGSTWILFSRFKIKVTSSASRFGLFVILLTFIPFCDWLYQLKGDSATGRILTWKVTQLMLNDHWFAGVGTGSFAANYVHYQGDFFSQSLKNIRSYGNIAGDNRYAFNDLLLIFGEGGVIGLVLFIVILVMCGQLLVKLFKHKQKHLFLTGACIASTLTALLVAGFTAYPLSMIPISILFWFMVAVLVSITPENKIMANIVSFKRIAVALLIISGLTFIYLGITRLNAYRAWTYITKHKKKSDEISQLLSLYDQLSTNAEFLNNIAKAHIEEKRYEKAILYLERAVKFSPYKGYYYTLGLCYEKTGNYHAAITQYAIIQNAIPNLIKPRYLLAMLHYNKGDYKMFQKLAVDVIDFTPKVNSMEVIKIKNELKKLLNR